MKAADVFTPGALPSVTYYDRSHLKLEETLMDAIETTGFLCSISGPSKCGKTVLCEKVVGEENRILITGAGISTVENFWEKLRQQMAIPRTHSKVNALTYGGEVSGAVEGSASLATLLTGKAALSGKTSASKQIADTDAFDAKSSSALFRLLREAGQVLVVDDFHYASVEAQKTLAHEFKEAAREGTRIVIISVTHRSDQAIRVNPDIRGRLKTIDIPYWTEKELREIPQKGFQKLNIQVDDETINNLVKESVSSPQLMQTLCLDLCRYAGYRETQALMTKVSLTKAHLQQLFEAAAGNANCLTAYNVVKAGPRVRGSGRKIYTNKNTVKEDLYNTILKAISFGEPSLSFTYQELKNRIEEIVPTDPPRGVDINRALTQMDKAVKEKLGEDRVLEYDEESQNGTLTVLDPYFMYYLRWAKK